MTSAKRKQYVRYETSKSEVLRIARSMGTFTQTQIRSRLPEISTSHVQRALKDLRSEGVIEVSGPTNAKPILLRMAAAEEVGQ